jgi:hypothetical protein
MACDVSSRQLAYSLKAHTDQMPITQRKLAGGDLHLPSPSVYARTAGTLAMPF